MYVRSVGIVGARYYCSLFIGLLSSCGSRVYLWWGGLSSFYLFTVSEAMIFIVRCFVEWPGNCGRRERMGMCSYFLIQYLCGISCRVRFQYVVN